MERITGYTRCSIWYQGWIESYLCVVKSILIQQLRIFLRQSHRLDIHVFVPETSLGDSSTRLPIWSVAIKVVSRQLLSPVLAVVAVFGLLGLASEL
jgi:hypothetical protein